MRLLVIDIETTGLRKENHDITVVALAELDSADGSLHNPRCINLLRARDESGGEAAAEALLAGICDEIDACQRIVAFNGIGFDLPFIAHKAGLPARVSEWASKTIDFCAFIQEHAGNRVGMSALCVTNQVRHKGRRLAERDAKTLRACLALRPCGRKCKAKAKTEHATPGRRLA